VHNNEADVVGGLDLLGSGATERLVIANSTIANNEALDSRYGAGVYLGYSAEISHSTISGNVESNTIPLPGGAGVTVRTGVVVDLDHTIVSGNTFRLGDMYFTSDIGAPAGSGGGTITGANNLVGNSGLSLP